MITPVEDLPHISSLLGISLKVKRDDLYPRNGGGSKGRKMQYILRETIKKKANALVTTGSANSNHARVVAITGAKHGWPVSVIIHDKEDYSKGNLKLMKLTGAKLIFTDREEVKDAMEKAVDDLTGKGYTPYSIYGGGHTVQGMVAYYDAVDEFLDESNGWWPDYVFHASGTGGTQAGLQVGFSKYHSKTKVIGISVSRSKENGKKIIEDAVTKLVSYLKIQQSMNEIYFYDDWTGNGYECVYPELIETIKKTAQIDGLLTDPTYTGKAMTALFDLCEEGRIEKGARVLFWHTGGLMNLMSSNEISLFE